VSAEGKRGDLAARALQASPEALLVVDARGIIRMVNARAEQLFGYRRQDLEGEPLDWLLPERLREPHREHFEEYLRAPRTRPMAARKPLRALRGDGAEILVRISLAPFETEGEPLVVCAVHDKHEDESFADQAVAAQRLESVGRFACGIAHNINNALTVIATHTDFAQQSLTNPESSEELSDDLTTIRRATESASEMTREVLTFARQRPQQPEPLRADALIAEMQRLLSGLLGDEVTLEVHTNAQPWHVHADRAGLSQALMNLASNARDAMPDGGRLQIGLSNVTLSDGDARQKGTGAQPGDYVVVTVRDTGTGIDPEVQPRIFEPFYTTKSAAEGTGLGLSTVYGFARQSGGFVRVDSEPGKGTQFEVYLPRAEQAPESAAPRQPAGPAAPTRSGTAKTVLLVEDDELVRRSASRVLRRAGYAVHEASDADSARAVWQREAGHIDLLVSDFGLPDENGYALGMQLREQRPSLPVLLTSGYGGEGETLPSELPFVEKPFTHATLLEAVGALLQPEPQAGSR
jgi:PAS domain S-box-containing protein